MSAKPSGDAYVYVGEGWRRLCLRRTFGPGGHIWQVSETAIGGLKRGATFEHWHLMMAYVLERCPLLMPDEYKAAYELKDTGSVSSSNSEKTETSFPDAALVLDGVIKYRDVDGVWCESAQRLSLTPADCRRIVDVARWAE